MWLYLPPSVSARDTQESNSDYQPWETLSQSATWKTTRRRPQFWQREWEKDSSLRLLSGVTLPPLTADRGVALWTSWLADSRVPHSQSQASTSERTTPETSGPMLPDSHLNSDIQLSFSKMLTESSNTTTSLSDQSYRQWTTGLRKDSTRRRKQALRTAGSDYSLWLSTERIRAFWPSPAQRDWKGSPGTTEFRNGRFIRTSDSTGTEYGAGLDGAAVNWRTPGANDANGGIEDWNSEHFKSITAPRIKLNHQAANWEPGENPKNWATATARDYKDGASAGTVPENSHLGRQAPNTYLSIRPDQKTRKDGHTCSVKCLRLNPAFVSLLMGVPLNWSVSSEAMEMESFLRWRLSLGATLLRLLFRRSV